jgi:cell division transport system permease protein
MGYMGFRRKSAPAYNPASAYALDHARTLLDSLGRLYRSPLSSLLTTAVIGIALALPCSLYLAIQNMQNATEGWKYVAKISLFLSPATGREEMRALSLRLGAREDIAEVETISADQALKDFRKRSGFAEALEVLDENPLPHVIILTPTLERSSEVETLAQELDALQEVDNTLLDMQWLRRLKAMMDTAYRVLIAIAAMLGVAVLLVIGNTIRLEILSRENEIRVTKLVGATDSFIRRPFLYGGIWYGLSGGILAWIMVNITILWVDGPAQEIALLYDSAYRVSGLGAADSLILLLLSALLGLAGSWLAMSRHLNKIEPE